MVCACVGFISSIFDYIQEARLPDTRTYTTQEAAVEAGISKSTLLRWIREQRIKDVRRDRNNWRVFSEQDVRRIKGMT